MRSFRVAKVSSKNLRPIIVKTASRKSYLMTDESPVYPKIGEGFTGHGTVNHGAKEYVRGTFWHTNTVESYFALLKRGVYGTFHNVSEAHSHGYLAEFDSRYDNRKVSDVERAEELLHGGHGDRRGDVGPLKGATGHSRGPRATQGGHGPLKGATGPARGRRATQGGSRTPRVGR